MGGEEDKAVEGEGERRGWQAGKSQMSKHTSFADLGAVRVGCQDGFDVSPSRPELVERQVEAGPQDSDQLHHRHPPHLHKPVALNTRASCSLVLLLSLMYIVDIMYTCSIPSPPSSSSLPPLIFCTITNMYYDDIVFESKMYWYCDLCC